MKSTINKTIIVTGGGSGGHVSPAITLIKYLKSEEKEYNIEYIGSKTGIERKLITDIGIPYHPISTGKLRRYISFNNFVDIFKILTGIFQSLFLLLKLRGKDTILFTTGGFVIVPPVLAAKVLGIPIFIHEQTSRMGLANHIASKFATKIFISFESSMDLFPKEKTYFSGQLLREEVFTPAPTRLKISEVEVFPNSKKILFITGGGNGAFFINEVIKKELSDLTKEYFVIHQVGQQHLKDFLPFKSESYLPTSFIENIVELMKVADVIVSRSGAGTVHELIALEKASIFIPLKIAQKNEQFQNAKEAEKILESIIALEDEYGTKYSTLDLIKKLSGPKVLKHQIRERAEDIMISHIRETFNN